MNKMNEATKKPISPVHLEFLSPAPVRPGMHDIDIAVVKLLNKFHSRITASWRAIPAPYHLLKTDKLPMEQKRHTLAITPNTDFIPACQGKGPDPAHDYDHPVTDLKFVASVSNTCWGLITYDPDIKTPEQLVGKKIGVEPAGGSPRVLSDAVLRDAWGIFDEVELIDCHPPQALKGMLAGDMDATFWMHAWETLDGFTCSMRNALEEKDTYWVGVSFEDIDRINRANNWKLSRVLVPMGSIGAAGPKLDPPEDVGLPSFFGAICAWDDTEEEVVYELVRFLDEQSALWPEYTGGCPLSLARMSMYPGMSDEMVHPGALRYYKENEIDIRGPVELHDMI
ncbi:TAXI family TRAP transporter solute-binding subunit [Thermodesulfobacteriota bacterium]